MTEFDRWKSRKLGNKELADDAEKLLRSCWNRALEVAKKPSDNLIAGQGGSKPIKNNIHNKIDKLKV